MFPDAPIGNIKKHLPPVLDELAALDLSDKPMVLMALATIRWRPQVSSRLTNLSRNTIHRPMDHRKDLGNIGKPDGEKFKGRGFIQLTGRHAYKVIGERIGLGNKLVETLDLASNPEIAAKILAAFLKGKGIPD